jgi:hypothetical protein
MQARLGGTRAGVAGASLAILLASPLAAFGEAVQVLQVAQGAASPSVSSGGVRSADAGVSGQFGTAAHGMPFDREVRLGANTKSVGVWRFETINFVTSEGRQFRWRFDTAREFDRFALARIAPSDLGVPAGTTVYVNGEIPIAP